MATRKTRIQNIQPSASADGKTAVTYQDKFQNVGAKKLNEIAKGFEGSGRNLIYGILAILVVAIGIAIFASWNRRSMNEAQAALGKAIRTSESQVTDAPMPAGSTDKTFKTEKERAEASIAEFQSVAEKFGGPVGDKAKYLAAVNRLSIDRAAGIAELNSLVSSSGEVGALAKFSLAQAQIADGKTDEAATLLTELSQMPDTVLARDTVNFELARVYEAQGKKEEAANLYFQIADSASKAKDLDGKPVPPSATAANAKKKLQTLDPAKAASINEAKSESE